MADFGDIPNNTAVTAGQSIRRNAGDSGFEGFSSVSVADTSTSGFSFVVDEDDMAANSPQIKLRAT